jgi:hypothetical protein
MRKHLLKCDLYFNNIIKGKSIVTSLTRERIGQSFQTSLFKRKMLKQTINTVFAISIFMNAQSFNVYADKYFFAFFKILDDFYHF